MVKKLAILCFFYWGTFSVLAQDVPQDSSRQVTIRDIHITGNKITKERIILREISVNDGNPRSLAHLVDTLEFDRQRIYNTNLFNVVKIRVQELGDGEADLHIDVEERWYIYPIPLFRLADRNFNDWWVNQNRNFQRVNFGIRYTQYNFRGRGERLRVILQSGFEQRYLFNYRIPYIDKKQQHGLLPEVFYLTSKNLGYETNDHLRNFILAEERMRESIGFSVLHTYRKRFYDVLFAGVGFAMTHIADTVALLNPNYLGDGRTQQRFFSLTYGYQFDNRDNINYPKTGNFFIASISKAGLSIYNDVDYWAVNATGSRFWDMNHGFYHGSSLSGYWSVGDRALLNYYGLGFEPNVLVRGYELDLIEGRSFLLTKNSTRKLIFDRQWDISKIMPIEQFRTLPMAVYGKIFFDGAYVWGFRNYPNNDRLTDKFIYGVGVGLDVVTMNDAVIRGEYSTNWDGERQFFLNFKADF